MNLNVRPHKMVSLVTLITSHIYTPISLKQLTFSIAIVYSLGVPFVFLETFVKFISKITNVDEYDHTKNKKRSTRIFSYIWNTYDLTAKERNIRFFSYIRISTIILQIKKRNIRFLFRVSEYVRSYCNKCTMYATGAL